MAQLGFIELPEAYGLTQANASQSLTAAGLTEAQAQAKFPRYWARLQWEGKTPAQFMALNFGVCAANDAFWKGHEHAISANPAGSGNIQIGPVSSMAVNERLYWPYGRIEGVGTFGDARFNTVLTVDHANWKGDPTKRNLIVSPTWGLAGGSMSYHESAKCTNISFRGARTSKYNDPSYQSSGLVCGDLGEGSHVGDIRANDFNDYGVLNERGTPAHFDNITAFCNNRAAVGLLGTALANITIGVLSGDDNPTLLEMLPSNGREAGANVLHVLSIKSESGVTGEGAFGPMHVWKGQSVAKLRGQFNVVIDALGYASSWITTGQLFWIDDRLTNGQPQSSKLTIQGAKGYGYAALLVDSRRGTYYDAPANYSAWSAEYTTSDGVLKVNGVVQQPKQCKVGMGPIGFVRPGETIDWLAGTPQQQVSGTAPPVDPPIPVACTTWEVGAWSAWGPCDPATLTQKRTRTVTAGPAGCTGTPPGVKPATEETQACTITQPPPGGTIATLTNVSVPTVSTNLPVNWPNAKTIAFEGFNTGTAVGGTICVGDGFALKVGGNGSVYLSVTGVGNTQCVPPIPAGTVKQNVPVNFTATLPVARTFTGLGAFAGSGSGEAFTCSKITVTG